jgi:general nucleoside transport system ATP-binding protein
MSEAAILELHGIAKSFGSVQALRGAGLVLAAGEVHALLGENGAGKSTLLHVAWGMFAPDQGTIRLNGHEVVFRSPRDARARGIGMVHQHFTSIGALTVAENIALSARGGPAQPGTGAALFGDLDPAVRAEALSVSLRQRLEISKALASGATILLLDEPSAALAPREVQELLAAVRQFARGGGAVALVTHKLAEVFAAADRVTVLRHGKVTLSAPVKEQTAESLASAMIGESEGRKVGRPQDSAATASDSPAFRSSRVVQLGGIDIHAGELVGIAAVEGNGQRELLRTLAGIGEAVATFVTPATEGPVAFIPEDRSTEGLIPELSLTENLLLGRDRDPRWARGPWLDWSAARRHAVRVMESYGIRAAGPEDLVARLSGGNQQKVVLARALDGTPRVLIAENPTRGLDIRATAYVHERLRAVARAGTAVIVYSSDLDEVLELAQRVLVVHAGLVVEAPRDAGRDVVGEMMLGVRKA